jgi:alpha,alpha-trehalase
MMKYLWDDETGYFFDYHVPSGTRSGFISATGMYPLMVKDFLSPKQAKRMIEFGLKNLEGPGGIFSTAKSSRDKEGDKTERQWEWPNGWAPHQMIIWQGLRNYNHFEDAERLISKWLLMIAENARDYNGTVPEKFDVEKRSHKVFAEYGNVGTHFSYITKEGFGWMNASYQYGLHLLPEKKKEELRKKLIP